MRKFEEEGVDRCEPNFKRSGTRMVGLSYVKEIASISAV